MYPKKLVVLVSQEERVHCRGCLRKAITGQLKVIQRSMTGDQGCAAVVGLVERQRSEPGYQAD